MAESSFTRSGNSAGKALSRRERMRPIHPGPSSSWLKCKHSSIDTFPVVGCVPDGRRIEALLVAEASPRGLRPVGRVEFRLPGVLDDDARDALVFLTRRAPCIRLRPSRGVRWVEPKLIATVKHFGRTGGGALRAGVLQRLAVST
jgi:ATP-dependent DNA ligase